MDCPLWVFFEPQIITKRLHSFGYISTNADYFNIESSVYIQTIEPL